MILRKFHPKVMPKTNEEWQAFAQSLVDQFDDLTTKIPVGESVLSAAYAITADTTWQDTGLSITLPAAGTYLIGGNVRGFGSVSATLNHISTKLYNATDAADITNSERDVIFASTTGASYISNISYSMIVTVNASKIIKLYAYRAAATWTASQISSDVSGRTNLTYVRIQ